MEHVRTNLDLHGNPRQTGDPTTKTRDRVRKAISEASAKIGTQMPRCAEHLKKHISKGEQLRSNPESPPEWVTE